MLRGILLPAPANTAINDQLKQSCLAGIMTHSSKHNCFICTGCREDQHGKCPGGPEGRWWDGEDRSLWLSMKDHAELMTSGLPREEAIKFNNQLNPPLPLHPDLHKPYWQYIGIDPLHVIVLGKLRGRAIVIIIIIIIIRPGQRPPSQVREIQA